MQKFPFISWEFFIPAGNSQAESSQAVQGAKYLKDDESFPEEIHTEFSHAMQDATYPHSVHAVHEIDKLISKYEIISISRLEIT